MEKNKKIEIYKNLILDVPGVNSAQFDKSIESSVTTSWGVNWDADFIARDILQNFRDSNLSEIEKVVVNTKNDKTNIKYIKTYKIIYRTLINYNNINFRIWSPAGRPARRSRMQNVVL